MLFWLFTDSLFSPFEMSLTLLHGLKCLAVVVVVVNCQDGVGFACALGAVEDSEWKMSMTKTRG